MKKVYIITAVLLFMMLYGCQSMTYNIDPNLGLHPGSSDSKVVNTIDETMTAHYMFWGLAPVSTPNIDEKRAQWINNGDQYIADIEINEENSFLDGFLAAITYGIYRPRTIHYKAKVYQKEGREI
jgi:hypothetical protein